MKNYTLVSGKTLHIDLAGAQYRRARNKSLQEVALALGFDQIIHAEASFNNINISCHSLLGQVEHTPARDTIQNDPIV